MLLTSQRMAAQSPIVQPASASQASFPPTSETPIRIDSGLQVVVFPDRVRVQYNIGLSPDAATTMLQQKSLDLPDVNDRRALMEAVRDLVIPEIQRRCRITAGQEPLELRAVDSQLFPKHYVQLTCIFEAALPVSGDVVRLQLVDGSFRGYDGDHSIALKTKEGAQVETSTVPLILARVPRRSSSNDSAAQRESARRAEAVILRMRTPANSQRKTDEPSPVPQTHSGQPAFKPSPPTPQVADGRWMVLTCAIGVCLAILALIVAWRRR
jgi:hypothetical protein